MGFLTKDGIHTTPEQRQTVHRFTLATVSPEQEKQEERGPRVTVHPTLPKIQKSPSLKGQPRARHSGRVLAGRQGQVQISSVVDTDTWRPEPSVAVWGPPQSAVTSASGSVPEPTRASPQSPPSQGSPRTNPKVNKGVPIFTLRKKRKRCNFYFILKTWTLRERISFGFWTLMWTNWIRFYYAVPSKSI